MPDDDVTFAVGDQVEILSGAFSGFPGTIEDVDNETRFAVVRVDVFDRAITIEIYLTDLRKSPHRPSAPDPKNGFQGTP